LVEVKGTLDELRELFGDGGTTKGKTRSTARKAYEPKSKKLATKRGPSAYNKKYAAAYKKLKKAHPRMSFAALAKKAHKAVKK